jgi:glycosyltransferase involved in cell wall biosynthesis
MQPAVSIVLPAFNRLEYLRPAVESVFAQTYSNWELLIADDGSDAETADYLLTISAAAQVRVLRLQHTGNPAFVRNMALRAARGIYVAFLDSDDLWAPDKLRIQLGVHAAQPQRRWSYTALRRINAAGASLETSDGHKRTLYEGAIFEQLLKLDVAVATPSVIVEKRLLDQAGGFDEDLRFFEDYDLWLRLSLLSEVSAVDQPLTMVRNHRQHYSANRAGVYEARFQLLNKHCRLPEISPLHAIVRVERAKNALALALVLAASGRRRQSLQMLWDSRACIGRRRGWWSSAGLILAMVLSPNSLREFWRNHRRRAVHMSAPL